MKKIAILTALVMIISSFAVCAAPSIEYMFYDEESSTYYAFGKYPNAGVGTTYNEVPNEVGVYLGDDFTTKYYLPKGDGETPAQYQASVALNPGRFGIGFTAPADYFGEDGFTVTPYLDHKYTGSILGDTVTMEADGEGIVASSDATLAHFDCYANGSGNGYEPAWLTPAFSPEVTNYTINQRYDVGGYYFNYKTANSKATVKDVLEGNVRTITVTAEDGVTTKTYTFTFSALGGNPLTIAADRSEGHGYTSAYVGTETKTDYDVLQLSNSGGRNYRPTITFSLNGFKINQLSAASEILLDIDLYAVNNCDKVKDVTLEVYGIESGVAANTAHDPANFERTAEPIATYTIYGDMVAGNFKYGIDVTEYVHKALAAGKAMLTFEIKLASFDFVGNTAIGDATVEFRTYAVGASKAGQKPVLLYK